MTIVMIHLIKQTQRWTTSYSQTCLVSVADDTDDLYQI